jgi:Dihaem cytochrome c
MTLPYRFAALSVLALAFSGLFFQRAQADGGRHFPPVTNAVVKEECGSCHLAFSPSMLPARSWQKMMGNLKNHFGTDASIDAAGVEKITRYLTDNAADSGGQRYGGRLMRDLSVQDAPLRITELPRWVRIHHEVSAREWRSKKVGSKANCVACHADAERGYYDE